MTVGGLTWALALAAPSPTKAQPGFLAGWSAPAGSASRGLALGDVDGDLDVDAYVAEFYGPDLLYLNDGTGHLARSAQVLDAGMGMCAELAPLDAGASLDLWLGRHLASNRVWFNDGAGNLADSAQALGAATSRGRCALGDVDADGDLDAYVATDTNAASNELFLNDGAGGFTASAQALGSIFSRAVALGDVDDDGDLDALVGNNGPNKLWLNNGSGTFTDSGQTVGTGGTFDVGLGDLDGDGDLDAVFANGTGSGDASEAWSNDGNGSFTLLSEAPYEEYSFSVEIFDCDDDDDLDVFMGNNTGQPNRLYLNDGAGGLIDGGAAVGIGGAYDARAADLDDDGDSDLVLSNLAHPEQVLLNDGSCHFSTGQLLGSSTGESVALGDIDGDGDRDAAIGTDGGIVRVLRNDGDGGFTDDDQWLSGGYGGSAMEVRLADFDDDGDLDLWMGLCCVGSGFSDDPADRLFLNDGLGHFTDSGQLLGSDYTTGLAVGDVDGDGDLDVAASHFDSLFSTGVNTLYLNDGDGTFAASPQALGTGENMAVGLADLDGDTDLDLFFGKRNAGSRVWRNDGSGAFTDSGQSLGSASVAALALGDLDGDGDNDAFLGNAAADTVWRNSGNGTFVDSGQALGAEDTTSVHLLDVDGDGDLDAWTTNTAALASAPNRLWLNDGSGVFTDSGWDVGTTTDGESALADVDGDLDPDVFVASFTGEHQLWVNQRYGPLFSDDFEDATTGAWSDTEP